MKLLPAFKNRSIPIVFCCNDHYIKFLSVAIQSIIENSLKNDNYDILILYTNIDEHNQNLIKSQFFGLKNFSCRFIDVKKEISEFNLSGRTHITKETFYRLLTIDILKPYTKVIYLDCDLVVDENIEHLYRINISNYYLAACRDIIGVGMSHAPFGFVRRHQYKILHLKNYNNYFNAGVLLMNLSLLRQNFTSAFLLKEAESHHWPWMDQDILNVLCQEKTLLLDDKWNMPNHRKHCKEARHAPEKIYLKWKRSSINPSIYHFAGPKMFKPWLYPSAYPSFYFWKYAYKTPFYKTIVNEMVNQTYFKIRKKKKIDVINNYINKIKNC